MEKSRVPKDHAALSCAATYPEDPFKPKAIPTKPFV